MLLAPAQLREFDELGYLFLPEAFSGEEVAVLRAEALSIYAADRQEVWREKSGAPRTAFAAHTYNEAFAVLGRHPRLVLPVQQLLGEPVYMHQFKINAKAPFDGEVWQWHQDYGTWARDDGMPEAARDEHRGVPRRGHGDQRAADADPQDPQDGRAGRRPRQGHHLLPAVDPGQRDGDAPRRGGAASSHPPASRAAVLMFHGNLVHASPPNITPYPRKIVYLTLCAVSNHIRKPTRPEWIAHQDFTPIVPVRDDALLAYARNHQRAAA